MAPASKQGGGAGAHALVLEPLGISIEAQEEAEGQDSADLRRTFLRVNYDLALRACAGNPFLYSTLLEQEHKFVSGNIPGQAKQG